ncbi:phosphoglucosamine mutase [Candidatus Riesia sp. GBBU]|nr:phosphoglucosamine mutase [Candidatus Riesia sp. GBBU]
MKTLKYFGTDGIRGKVGIDPITPDFFLKLGWAVGTVLSRKKSKKIIVGTDTRISRYMLKSSFEAGLNASGVSSIFAGLIPSPAVSYLTRKYKIDAGVSISASHNQYYDNGIKFFSVFGSKISRNLELSIEKEIEKSIKYAKQHKFGKNHVVNFDREYIEYCKNTFPNDISLKKLKIVLDCANGSTYHIAPRVLNELEANITTIGCSPNGTNINFRCGTTDISSLKKTVIEKRADLGFALDGDGDRVILVDHKGNKVDGDKILYIIAYNALKNSGFVGGVVGTSMSNIGLEISLRKIGIPFVRTKVGDRHIFNKLQEKRWNFGAESSGHIILLDKMNTGDGIIAGLQVLGIIVKENTSLHDLCKDVKLVPQTVLNIEFKDSYKNLIKSKVTTVVKQLRNKFKRKVRIICRKSGTEPLIRIMIEGKNKKKIQEIIYNIKRKIK